jgi:hypothetical protein
MDGDTVQTPPPDGPNFADPGLLATMGGGAPPTPQIPPQQVSQMGGMPTDPNTIEATAAAVHHSRMAHVMNTVSDLMGGSTTVHVTKHPDGTVDITHDPSTQGEKWSRIAAAALSGAAKGFSVGQGPGGIPRAAGAGMDAGQQVQKQPEENAMQQQEFADKDVLFKANHAALDQRYVQNAEAMKQNNLKFSQDQMDRYNAIEKHITDAPGSEVIGDFDGVNDLPSFFAKYPQAMKGHVSDPNSYLSLFPQANGKTRVIQFSKPMGEQIMKNPPPIPVDYFDGPSGTIKTRNMAPAQGINYNDYQTALKGQLALNSKLALDVNDKLNPKPEVPDTSGKAYGLALNEKDAQKKAGYLALGKQLEAKELREKEAGRAVTTNPYQPTPGAPTTTTTGEPIIGRQYGGGDPTSSFETNARMIREGKKAPSQIKPMRGKGQPTEADYIARADQIDRAAGGPGLNEQEAEQQYKTMTQTREEYAPKGTTGKKIIAMNTLLEHLGEVHDATQELRNTGSPYLNKPYNELRRDVAGNVDVGPAAIRAAAPAHEYANVLSNNTALNNDEKAGLPNLLNENQTPAIQQANSKQMAKTIIDRLDPVLSAYRDNMRGQEPATGLTPRAVETLRHMGLYDAAMKQLHPNGQVPQQPQAAPPPAAAVPPDATHTQTLNGKVVGYTDSKGVYHNLPGAK